MRIVKTKWLLLVGPAVAATAIMSGQASATTFASVAGDAFAAGGASIFDGGSISNGVVSGNHIQVSSPLGSRTNR
jgi:hypothetical protein